MFASSQDSRAKRRGIVLILVLGMLGLMALIGVTFATFAGQSLINSRNFQQGVSRPQAEVLMDYALAQLINDTNNPLSAIRGHSLLRDMYGNDSTFRGSNPSANPASETGGLLSQVVYPTGASSTLHLTGVQQHPTTTATPFYNQLQYATNIPTTGQYYGLDFTRWIVRFNNHVQQTFEILEDDFSGAYHNFTFSNNLANQTLDPTYVTDYNATYGNTTVPLSSSDWTAFIYSDPNLGALVTPASPPTTTTTTVFKNYSNLSHELSIASKNAGTLDGTSGIVSSPFVLDGRYMRAFNGAGLTRLDSTSSAIYPYNFAAYGNFRLSGLDPDAVGMDEDYDACDLENWYLAIQSADGQIVIPSFHRPGILTSTDWTSNKGFGSSKILRPRQADNSPLFPADPSIPDANGKLTYDVDNDGDGITDSVWLDLGYPVQRDPGGKMYKPLFAFMVLGLNGRLPLNTVGNLQARAIGDRTNNSNAVFTTPLPNSTGQIPYPGPSGDGTIYHPTYSSQSYFDAPLWDHTSHVGFSVNEINPKFALQNAPSNLFPSNPPSGTVGINATGTNYGQYDDAFINVAITQLRNILAGTIPTDVSNPVSATNYPNSMNSYYGTLTNNGDLNVVYVDGQRWVFPNNVADANDAVDTTATPNTVTRALPAKPGRWGEPDGINRFMYTANGNPAYGGLAYPPYWFQNLSRAGRSYYTGGTNDILDDDFDGTDPFLANTNQIPTNGVATQFTVVSNLGMTSAEAMGNQYTLPLTWTGATSTVSIPFVRQYPEFVDFMDGAGQIGIASERIRRFVTPQDPAGTGRLVSFMNRPGNEADYGLGSDSRGRTGYFRYFRPAGMPQEVRYPYFNDSVTSFPYPYTTGSGNGQRFLMPLMIPAGYAQTSGTVGTRSDTHNNRLHGYQGFLTPASLATTATALPPAAQTLPAPPQAIASMGTMPYDWDQSSYTGDGAVPNGYGNPSNSNKILIQAPMINPYVPLLTPPVAATPPTYTVNNPLYTSINTEYGPNLGAIGDLSATGSGAGAYPIPFANYDTTSYAAYGVPVVNGYIGGSLNKDEADEMNVYTSNHFDMAYGPSDLEWLYRKQDVDGSTLNSRLSKLAPVSFTNPADGLTRRRLFSTDVFDLISFAYANDNPAPYAGAAYVTSGGHSATSDHNFTFNSRFAANASPSLELMNQVVVDSTTSGADGLFVTPNAYANFITTEFLPNPTLPPQSPAGNSLTSYFPNSSYVGGTPITLPAQLSPGASGGNLFANAFTNAQIDNVTKLVTPFGSVSSVQVQTPSVAHRDRKINLNYPLPVSNDPAEPIRQKWCRETYQMLKAILPPASVDTPEELAQLSQFVVNIIDFRDPDCTMTRFVNTDLEVTDVLTHTALNQQLDPADLTWTVSVPGVKFATKPLPGAHFPYDPSLYHPNGDNNGNPGDGNGNLNPFLVQHGMEYNPIAINEALAYQAQYGTSPATTLTNYQAMFVEIVNTLTEEQNNQGVTGTPSITNSSAVSLNGWDIIIAPDNFGWGRPDPISGEVNIAAYPLWIPDPTSATPTAPPVAAKRPHPTTTDTNLLNIQGSVQQYSIPSTAKAVAAINSGTNNPYYYVIGDYRTGNTATSGGSVAVNTTVEKTPVANATGTGTTNGVDLQLPTTFRIPVATGTGAQYYWVYLRRPANPFDTAAPSQQFPNKEMVVVDAMRFPVINSLGAAVTNATASPPVVTASSNAIYSAQRLQPYRGGHLLRVDTAPPSGLPVAPPAPTDPPVPAAGAKSICPPSPPYAYGYTEQMAQPGTGSGSGQYSYMTTTGTPPVSTAAGVATSPAIQQSINSATPNPRDQRWSHLPFHDRDFSSAAELLLVPGCPPGLFTKQFVEEPYPGNIFADTTTTPAAATGTDDRDFAATIVSPTGTTNPSLVGRADFNAPVSGSFAEPPNPTFPYLSDNFYYTAASVGTPPAPSGGGNYDTNYTRLTTEIGGWTGAGWHKMLEFFEVPSSANGAIAPTDRGDNYDFSRADTKPGQININLIVDEEVFAGLVDDPRLNESLAAASSTIPYVVSQIDANGYPGQDSSGNVTGRSAMFNQPSTNYVNGTSTTGTPFSPNPNYGRGYVYRDPNLANYPASVTVPPTYAYQQVHGIKAAFSDFLKLRHGGSGYLFGYGAGPTGSGDFVAGPIVTAPNSITHPLAAERPYRSLSYPDINYTILRPASLPPSPKDSNTTIRYIASSPPMPSIAAGDPGDLTGLFRYLTDPNDVFPYVAFNPYLPAMHESKNTFASSPRDFPYVQDPGIKNPFLSTQYVNSTAALNAAITGTSPPMPTTQRYLAPPYAVQDPRPSSPATTLIPAAPFPPTIPPTPARRLFQIADVDRLAYGYSTVPTKGPTSNASLLGQVDISTHNAVNAALVADPTTSPPDASLAQEYQVNKPTITLQLSTLPAASAIAGAIVAAGGTAPGPLSSLNPNAAGTLQQVPYPPSLVDQARSIFAADNYTPQALVTIPSATPPSQTTVANNFLGANYATNTTTNTTNYDYRQHPAYRTEWLQKISNLTTVRTHQYAVWITVGFFEVVQTGTPELGVPDAVGQELGLAAGRNVRYRSFFVIDRTKATGFNPYFPGNFRDCVTYRRRIE